MRPILVCFAVFALATSTRLAGQLVDKNKAPNTANEGISRPLVGGYPSQIGDGAWGSDANASRNVIAYDPFRAIRRGRQLFQRKFSRLEGQGAVTGRRRRRHRRRSRNRRGPCRQLRRVPRPAARLGRLRRRRRHAPRQPRRAAPVRPRPEGDAGRRDHRGPASDARGGRSRRPRDAARPVDARSPARASRYGAITRVAGRPRRHVAASRASNADLRVRPFFAHGDTISIREFVVGALKNEMGLQAHDPDLAAAQAGRRVDRRQAWCSNGRSTRIEQPPADEGGRRDGIEQRTALVDLLEFYLLNYFKAGTGEQTQAREARPQDVRAGRAARRATCQTLAIERDRRVADVETAFDPISGHLQPAVRHRELAAGQRRRRSDSRASAEGPRPAAVPRREHLHRLQASRPRARPSTSATTTARCARSS